MSIVYLNGDYIPHSEAQLSIMDRAVLFGDALYEVIPVYQGLLIGEQGHIDRLQMGLSETQIPSPLTNSEWHSIFIELLKRNQRDNQDAMIYLQVSRGTETKRAHAWQADTQPTVFAYTDALPSVDLERYQKGFKVISQTDIRRETCYIKSTSLQVNTIMQHQAKAAGAIEAVLFRGDRLSEGSTSNVFIVKDGCVHTPIANQFILHGITRQLVIDCAKINGLDIIERDIQRDEVLAADEVWLTSSTKEVCPIVQIDDHTINNGSTGPVWAQMIQWYQNHTRSTNNNE